MNSKNKMQMQLRPFRKKKSIGDEDLGYEEKPPKSHKKSKSKAIIEKERSLDEVSSIYKIINYFSKNSFLIYQKKMKINILYELK